MAAKTRSTRNARVELQAWYLHGLPPKLARAAGSGTVDLRAVDALDGEMRSFLALSRAQKEAA